MVESAEIDGELMLLITPLKQEMKPMTLLIEGVVLWNGSGTVCRDGEALCFRVPNGDISIWTDGESVEEYHAGCTGPYLSVKLNRPVAVSSGKRRTAAELRPLLDAAREKVAADAARFGDVVEAYTAMKTCLAWDTVYEPENKQFCSPVSRLWSISWGGYVLFCWDTYFSAMMAIPESEELACANAAAITAELTESGFVPNFGAADDNKSRDRSQRRLVLWQCGKSIAGTATGILCAVCSINCSAGTGGLRNTECWKMVSFAGDLIRFSLERDVIGKHTTSTAPGARRWNQGLTIRQCTMMFLLIKSGI